MTLRALASKFYLRLKYIIHFKNVSSSSFQVWFTLDRKCFSYVFFKIELLEERYRKRKLDILRKSIFYDSKIFIFSLCHKMVTIVLITEFDIINL